MGVDAVKNSELGNARAHRENRVLGLVRFGEQTDVCGFHDGRRAEIGDGDRAGSTSLTEAHGLYDIARRARMGNADRDVSSLEVRRNDRLHVVVTAGLRAKAETKKFMGGILRDGGRVAKPEDDDTICRADHLCRAIQGFGVEHALRAV